LRVFLTQYRKGVFEAVHSIPEPIITDAASSLTTAIRSNAQIFAFGNGGSEALARHLNYALMRQVPSQFRVHTQTNPGPEFSGMAPHQEIFSWMLRRSAMRGDLVFLVSASGNSKNICDVALTAKQSNLKVVSLSANGKINQQPEVDVKIVIDGRDQQIVEDAALTVIHIISSLVSSELAGIKTDPKKVLKDYLKTLSNGFRQLKGVGLEILVPALVRSYLLGNCVRFDAPDGDAMVMDAFHTAHNQKWDAFQGVPRHPTNRVYSGIPTCHLSGVANDGLEGWNYALEVRDTLGAGDVEVILHTGPTPPEASQHLMYEAGRKRIRIYRINFDLGDCFPEYTMVQVTGHLLGRLVNAMLRRHLVDVVATSRFFDRVDVDELLRYDLAMLRTADKNRAMIFADQMIEWTEDPLRSKSER
jgi:D-sedoheptulose 7-phosphate isomerase